MQDGDRISKKYSAFQKTRLQKRKRQKRCSPALGNMLPKIVVFCKSMYFTFVKAKRFTMHLLKKRTVRKRAYAAKRYSKTSVKQGKYRPKQRKQPKSLHCIRPAKKSARTKNVRAFQMICKVNNFTIWPRFPCHCHAGGAPFWGAAGRLSCSGGRKQTRWPAFCRTETRSFVARQSVAPLSFGCTAICRPANETSR